MPDVSQHFQTGPVRQIDVEQDRSGLFSLECGQGRGRRFGLDWFVTPAAQSFAERPSNHLLVIDDEDLLFVIFQSIVFNFPVACSAELFKGDSDYMRPRRTSENLLRYLSFLSFFV
jgi:hypothetical protein